MSARDLRICECGHIGDDHGSLEDDDHCLACTCLFFVEDLPPTPPDAKEHQT